MALLQDVLVWLPDWILFLYASTVKIVQILKLSYIKEDKYF